MMAVHLHTGELSLPSQFLPDKDDDIPSQEQTPFNKNNTSSLKLKPQVLPPHHHHHFGSHISSMPHSTEDSLLQRNHKDDDFIAELTRQMAHFMFQDDDKLSFSPIGSDNLDMSWDSMDSPQSTLWPPLGSNQGSPEGPSQESSPPATPGNSKQSCSWDTQKVLRMFEKMNLDEREHSKHSHGNGIKSSNNVNVSLGLCSNQSLIDDQIRAIQEQVQKQKGERQAQAQALQSEPKEQIQQFQKKGKTNGGTGNGRRARPPALFSCNTRPVPLQQQAGSGMRAVFLGGSSSRSGSCGTGVFLPRGSGTSAPSESRKKPGCSTVLIPARVVQALQHHFDQMAATSGPKAGSFPPLHDVLVSNRDGMYSLQKRQSRKAPANMQNDMNLLPQEWTY